MKNWKKVSLLTTIVIFGLLIMIWFFLGLHISRSSSDIEFSPGTTSETGVPEYNDSIPDNIILFIADGMGFGHLSLALHTLQEENKSSVWQDFEVKGWHDARSLIGSLTDSEASATAMATGTSTNFGHIGIDNDGNILENIFELASEKGYATGIVTDSYVWDGTPAAFSAHTRNEDDARDILTQIAASELDLVFGELEDLGEDDVPEWEESIEILSKRFKILDRDLNLSGTQETDVPVAAIYEEDEVQDLSSDPNLPKLTEVALNYLSSKDKPFILLVECEELDSASHENDTDRVIEGLKSIQETLSLVMSYTRSQGNTLLIFTSDHETGGLAAVSDFNKYPNMQVRWSTNNHTAAVVPLFADGPGASYLSDVHRNSDIGKRLKEIITRSSNSLE